MTPPSQPGYATSRDTSTQVEYGYAMIRFDLGDGRYNDLIVKSYYKKGLSVNFYPSDRGKYENGIWYHAKNNQFLSLEDESIFGIYLL